MTPASRRLAAVGLLLALGLALYLPRLGHEILRHPLEARYALAAREMLRVVRAGGRIGLANWTPEGFIGQLFKVIGHYLPPPAGLKSPALWGTEAHIAGLFGAQAADIRYERKSFNFRYRSAAHWLQIFRDYYGPTHKAFAALDPARQDALAKDITALLSRLNTAGLSSLVVPGEYLEVVITKR